MAMYWRRPLTAIHDWWGGTKSAASSECPAHSEDVLQYRGTSETRCFIERGDLLAEDADKRKTGSMPGLSKSGSFADQPTPASRPSVVINRLLHMVRDLRRQWMTVHQVEFELVFRMGY